MVQSGNKISGLALQPALQFISVTRNNSVYIYYRSFEVREIVMLTHRPQTSLYWPSGKIHYTYFTI